ncbi:hypothetical protein D8674_001626 [Pyrus ussuriensis x Pyrus communis]|uniref:Late embryogenesis abundant protein LEA-2 subgroup domain-containing protein n=1 Tax=Pyrus ussuriensis x Pyrus communis TaxID=2448454 RepID=A0A5N5F6R2_9ROSA|nr:hypothetical protein D8674_001626 [Pyrus ussuriensis x Pyrus communis]
MAAEKEATSPPAPPANGYTRSDQESAVAADPAELKRNKRMRCLLYVVVFAVFQVVVITVFALTVMKIKTPKYRVRSASLSEFEVGSVTSPSFNLVMDVQFGVKNTNFGHFKYEDGIVEFDYRGTKIGQTDVYEARARARSTKKVDASLYLSSNELKGNSQLASDISSGIIPVTSTSRLEGKIHLMKVIKKKRSAQMNCTMEIVLATQSVQNIVCK